MRRVLFVAPRFHSNYIGWTQRLASSGWESIFIVTTEGPSEHHESAIEVIRAPVSSVSSILTRFGVFKGENAPNTGPSLWWTLRTLWRIHPDVVIIRGRQSLLSITAGIACRALRLRSVVYQQEPLRPFHPESRRHKVYDTLMFSARMTPVFGYGTLRRSSSWRFIPFEPPIVQIPSGIQRQRRSIVTIGKFGSPRKNIELLLKVVSRMSDIELHICVIGSSDTDVIHESWSSLIERIGAQRVTVLPNLDHDKVMLRLATSSVFVLPAKDEPASISIVEALNLDLRVVCSDSCGTRDYIPPGKGLIFRTDDAVELERCIRLALDAPDLPVDPEQVAMWQDRQLELVRIEEFVNSLVPRQRTRRRARQIVG